MKVKVMAAVAVILISLSAGPGLALASSVSVASALSLAVVPPTLPADGLNHQVVVVSLLDSARHMTVALNDTTVYLTSSQVDVASIQSPIVIHAGQSYVVANASVTLTPGTSTLTASSVGLTSAYVQLKTMIPSGIPASLAVFCAPPFQPLGEHQGQLVVEMLDQAGHPTRAASATPILLTSSNNEIAMPLASNFTLPVNGTVATVGYTSDQGGSLPGSATVTATASGFNSGYAQVTVSNSTGRAPVGLAVQSDPQELIADGRSYQALTVMLRDENGSATAAPAVSGGVYVQLTSSQPSVLSVPPVALIPAGQTYVLVDATSTVSPGTVTITATSIGMASASVQLDTVAPAPSKLALYVAPDDPVVTSRGSAALLFVQLQDGSSSPALGRKATNVVITSSNDSLTSTALELIIPRGQDYGVLRLGLDASSQGVLTASSSGLRSSNASLASFMAPLQASLSSASSSIYQNETDVLTLSAYALGVPLKGASVTWNSTGGILTADAGTTDAAGRATMVLKPTGLGLATIEARVDSPAMGTANLTATVYVLPSPVRHQPSLLERILSYWLYIAIGAAAAAIVSVVLLRRRRKSAESDEESFELPS